MNYEVAARGDPVHPYRVLQFYNNNNNGTTIHYNYYVFIIRQD